MNARYKADETCYPCKKESQQLKTCLLGYGVTADLAKLIRLTTKNLFTTNSTDLWTLIIINTSIKTNSWKEDSRAVLDIKTRLRRTLTGRIKGMVGSCCRGEPARKIDPRRLT